MDYLEDIREQIILHLPTWSDVKKNEIILERMTGISNYTYKATPQNHSLPPIIFRKFG